MKIRHSKFNVRKDASSRTYNGIVFDSALEMKYYIEMVLPRLKSGEYKKCEMQKPYVLQPAYKHNGARVRALEYVADFYIVDCDGVEHVIDIKGCPDSVAKIKRKLFWYVYPDLDYIWVGYSKRFGGWADYDEINKSTRKRKRQSIFKD